MCFSMSVRVCLFVCVCFSMSVTACACDIILFYACRVVYKILIDDPPRPYTITSYLSSSPVCCSCREGLFKLTVFFFIIIIIVGASSAIPDDIECYTAVKKKKKLTRRSRSYRKTNALGRLLAWGPMSLPRDLRRDRTDVHRLRFR